MTDTIVSGRAGGRARRRFVNGIDGWIVGTTAVAFAVATPLAAVIILAVTPTDDIWRHLAETVLPLYLGETALLILGVGLGTLVIGVGTAWLVTMCRFPGGAVFEWALLLPFAVPSYIVAYVFTDLFEYAGPVQAGLRAAFGWTRPGDYWFPEIRSLGGAVLVMTLVLYPYVYLLARAAFLEQSVCVLEVGRTLGRGPWRAFLEVALPLARPAIVVGVSLALMEALNDFGTVDFFAVATFTAGIYDVWRNLGNAEGAAQLAVVMMAFVLVLIVAERRARSDRRFFHTSARYRPLPRPRLRGIRAGLAVLACLLPVLAGFVAPAAVLGRYALIYYDRSLAGGFLADMGNSLILSLSAAAAATAIGLFLAYAARLGSRTARLAARFASLGYALPGAVLALGIMFPLAGLDNAVDAAMRRWFGVSTGLILSGTLFAICYGYVARFLALAFGAAEASLAKVTPSMDGAARTLGHGPLGTLRRVHLPLIGGGVLTAALLVFVDGMKELPMTMVLRPFNVETLATRAHQYASHELLGEGALSALAIVAAGILPVILLSRAIRHARPGQPVASPTVVAP